jgi:hypothetical protein
MFHRQLKLTLSVALLSTVCFTLSAAEPAARWLKGNLHTHSLWSDGDDYPDMIVDWYKTQGYDFLALSDHNVVQLEERWIHSKTNKGGLAAFEKYKSKFGDWVETKEENGQLKVRLKTLTDLRKKFDEANKFLLIPAEEVTDRYKAWPVHMCASNVREIIKPKGGDSVLEILQNNINQVEEQRKRTGQPMIVHVNHPNFQWGITAEDMLPVKGERFFEVYNGHPTVYNEGDATHASMDKLWDILLAFRLAELGLEPLYGVGTDDSHAYHKLGPKLSNVGRGWIKVRSAKLTPEDIIKAMEAGEFFASSGVDLKDVRRDKKQYVVEINGEPGVTYTTQFIGTRKGFDRKHEPVRAANGEVLRVTHKYSKDVGEVLAEVKGTTAGYTLKGDEIYVRAKIVSSKAKANGVFDGEVESAWTQPLITGVK